MANKIKDTDYLAISARVRAMETTLLTAERMERLLEARSDEEVSKLLQDCGYPELDAARPEAMDAALSQAREELLTDLGDGAPDPGYIDIFKLKYDYHNAKAILKAAAMGTSPDRMLMDMGRIGAAELKTAVESGELDKLPGALPAAVAEAKSVLDTTRDPQLSDIVLDRWMYRDMAQVAEDTGSQFLRGYVETQIDAANLRALLQHLVHQGGLAVVNVGDDGYVSQMFVLHIWNIPSCFLPSIDNSRQTALQIREERLSILVN